MFRTLFCFWILAAPVSTVNAENRLWEVRVASNETKKSTTLFFVEIEPSGQVYKAYPKPRVPLGQFRKSENRKPTSFLPAKTVSKEALFWLVSANIVDPSKLEPEPLNLYRSLILGSTGTELTLEETPQLLQPQKWTGPVANSDFPEVEIGPLKLDWKDVQLVPVPEEERKKIEQLEKGLLGKWQFDRMTDWLGEPPHDGLQYKSLQFCADGKCITDQGDKLYWVDGKFLRINFHEEPEWEKYSSSEEYDFEQPSPNELVIRPVDLVEHPPSRTKLDAPEEKYPEDGLKRVYYFKRK